MTSLRRYVQRKADRFQNFNRGYVIQPLKLGREWIVIFHNFLWAYLLSNVSTPMMVKLFSVYERGTWPHGMAVDYFLSIPLTVFKDKISLHILSSLRKCI